MYCIICIQICNKKEVSPCPFKVIPNILIVLCSLKHSNTTNVVETVVNPFYENVKEKHKNLSISNSVCIVNYFFVCIVKWHLLPQKDKTSNKWHILPLNTKLQILNVECL